MNNHKIRQKSYSLLVRSLADHIVDIEQYKICMS
jgi:hypothetical protein